MKPPTPHSRQKWLSPTEVFNLRKGEAHVWRAIVDIPAPRLQVFWETLNNEEQERAERFRFAQHRTRFIATRGILRCLVGQYLDRLPHDIEFGTGHKGKPFIENYVSPKLHFNISHSHKVALFAFSHDSEVGIDVEGPNPRLDYKAMAKRIMSKQEQRWIQSLPNAKQKFAFMVCWTRKEAFVKAHGTGLMFPLRDVTVTFLPNQPASLVKIENPKLNSQIWSLHPIDARAQYVGALVVAGQPQLIRYWDYQKWESQMKIK